MPGASPPHRVHGPCAVAGRIRLACKVIFVGAGLCGSWALWSWALWEWRPRRDWLQTTIGPRAGPLQGEAPPGQSVFCKNVGQGGRVKDAVGPDFKLLWGGGLQALAGFNAQGAEALVEQTCK